MRILMMVLVGMLLHAANAHAVPLTVGFEALNASNITLTGSITYGSTDSPSALNIIPPLSPNAAYSLSSWNVAINVPTQFGDLLPPLITLSSGLAGNTGTLCLGQCIFGESSIRVTLFQGRVAHSSAQL